jgi:hypothetical protein
MSDKEQENKLTLANTHSLSIRASLVSRGLKDVSDNEPTNMRSWLDSFPDGSALFFEFMDGSDFPIDNRDVSHQRKHRLEMTDEEQFLALVEDPCSGLLSLWAFNIDAEENKYLCRGYIEIEGIHPIERSAKFEMGHEKQKIMSAIGILIRKLVGNQDLIRIYCDGDTLLRFHCSDVREVQAFIQEMNSTLHKTIISIKKPDGTIARRKSELYLELTEYRATR